MLLFLTNSFSQTPVPTGNVSGTWTAENSPYLVAGDITVPDGSVLNINPYVTVEFQGYYKLTVEGQLLAVGKQDSLILFTVNDTTGFYDEDTIAGGWHGIRFENNTSTDTSEIVYCKIQYGKIIDGSGTGCAVFVQSLPYFIMENSIITNNYCKNRSIVRIDSTNISFFGNKCYYNKSFGATVLIKHIFYVQCVNNIFVSNKGAGLRLFEVKNADIINNLICNNSNSGIWITSYSNACFDFILANNTLCNNSPYQVLTEELYTTVKFYNTVLWGYTIKNVGSGSNSGCSFYYCDIQNGINSLPTYDLIDYENNIETNPEFINPSQGIGWEYDALAADWSLKKTSPCINAGTPDTTGLNLNLPVSDLAGKERIYNGRVDIGAYEYPGYINVNEDKSTGYFNVFPNPGDESVNVLLILNRPENIKLQIFTQYGKMIYNEDIKNSGRINERINVSDYPAGIYILKITTSENEYLEKVIIK